MNFSKGSVKRAGAAALLSSLILSGLAFSTSTSYAADPIVGGKAVVSNTDGDTIRVREGAGTSFEQVADAVEGDTVTVLAGPKKDEAGRVWYKVEARGGAGWMSASFLSAGEAEAAKPKASQASVPAGPRLAGTARVANTDGDPLRVRSSANSDGGVVATLSPNTSVSIKAGPVADSSGTAWYQISANGTTGWAMAQYLSQAQAPAAPAAPVAPAAPAAPAGPKLTGTARVANTDGDPLRVRSSAARSGELVTTLSPGTSVSIKSGPVADSNGTAWYQVSANGTTGWVMAEYLTQGQSPAKPVVAPVAPAAPAGPRLAGFGRVANTDGDALRVRASASRSGRVVTSLSPGASVAIKSGPIATGDGSSWYQISANGATGWAMAQYLVQSTAPAEPVVALASKPAQAAPTAVAAAAGAVAKPAAPKAVEQPRTGTARGAELPVEVVTFSNVGQSIVNTAMKYNGYRYRYGGTTPSGFDCSGFTYYVCNRAGVKVSRDMRAQYNSGSHPTSSQLQPGDLVFFQNTYRRGLSHVGIYVGNRRFIHAGNESSGVLVSSLDTSYWRSHWYGATRLR